jgi:hypothetical protein
VEKSDLQEHVCRPYCDYFKPGINEEFLCRGAEIVGRWLRDGRLSPATCTEPFPEESLVPGQEAELETAVCTGCSFRSEDCDFQSNPPPPDCRPCGGLVLLHGLRNRGVITIPELETLRHDAD